MHVFWVHAHSGFLMHFFLLKPHGSNRVESALQFLWPLVRSQMQPAPTSSRGERRVAAAAEEDGRKVWAAVVAEAAGRGAAAGGPGRRRRRRRVRLERRAPMQGGERRTFVGAALLFKVHAAFARVLRGLLVEVLRRRRVEQQRGQKHGQQPVRRHGAARYISGFCGTHARTRCNQQGGELGRRGLCARPERVAATGIYERRVGR